jgi:hypothetical protein
MKSHSSILHSAIFFLLGLTSISLLFWLTTPLLSSRANSFAAQSCTFTINPTSRNFEAGGGTSGVAVTASASSCTWSASSNAPWISISSGSSGTGNGTVAFSVAANTGASRSGTINIAGQTFTVNQSAPSLAGFQFYPLPQPVRLLDTRPGESACFAPGLPLGNDAVRTQPAVGTCSGATIPPTAKAVVGNATVVNFISSGFHWITLYPSDAPQPLASNLNFSDNQIVPNQFTVGLGPDGAFKIYSHASTDFVVDITGYYAPPGTGGLYYHPLPAPVRLFESRLGESGCDAPGVPLGNDATRTVTAHGTCLGATIPSSAKAIVGNATVVNFISTGFHWITLYPFGTPQPLASNLNFTASEIVPNAFVVGLSNDGKFNIYSHASTHFIVDVAGYFSNEAVDVNGQGLLYNALPTPIRLLDTRPGQIGCDAPGVPLGNDATLTETAHRTCFGVTIPNSAKAVVGNATVVNFISTGFHWITLYPFGAAQPTASNLNFHENHIVPNAFVVGLSNDGKFNIYSHASTHFVVDLGGYYSASGVNVAPLVDAGADQTIASSGTANLIGLATDDGLPSGTLTTTWSKVSGPGDVTFGNAYQVVTTATFSATGTYVLRLSGSDSALTTNDDVTITVNPPLAVNAGADQVVTLPNTAMLAGSVTGGSPPIAISWSKVSGPGTVLFSNASSAISNAIFAVNGVYVLRLSATDLLGTVTDDVQVTVNADPTPPPPDPSTVAPPLDMTVATTIGTGTQFLYTGANPIQTGVAPGTINPVRAAVLKGRVLDKNNNPLPLVKITVLDHPEFGQTMSRADGRFDMAVNGGGVITVKYEKVGFQTLQRTENVPWQDYCGLPDAVMIGFDPQVTFIDLLASTPIQVAQSSTNTDTSGTRRTALLFRQGTTATMKLPGGAMAGIDKMHVRATEFTVGANGFNAMPGDLPANSGYTYAVDYSIDEAVAAGALEVSFSQPVIQYNENFLNFPVGIDIPLGAYDPEKGQWIASDIGRVVKILSITGGTANLDVIGNGQPATDPEYAALGITVAERQSLATLYAVNQSLWRVPIIHFSKWDSNWPFGPPGDAQPPGGDPPMCDT